MTLKNRIFYEEYFKCLKINNQFIFSASHETQFKKTMAKVKFPYDKISESYSEAENTKAKTNSQKPKIILCKNNSIDSDTSTNDSTSDDTLESSHYCPPNYSNSFGDIIEQIKKLRFIRSCSKVEKKLPNSRKKSSSTESMDNNSKHSELTNDDDDDALNSNYCKQYYQVNIYNDDNKKDKDDEESLNTTDLDNQSDDDGDDDGNLIERGPVRPQLNAIRSKPYDTLDWLLQSDNYSPLECSDRHRTETSDYETSIQQLLTDTDYRERIDSCLDQLSDSSQKSPVFNGNLDSISRQKFSNSQQSMVRFFYFTITINFHSFTNAKLIKFIQILKLLFKYFN